MTTRAACRGGGLALALALAGLLAPFAAVEAANIRLQIDDLPNQGFNDPTPAGPVRGNGGQTLGQQRRNVFSAAAREWETRIVSPIDIVVRVKFEALDCEATRGTLGTGGATRIARDFPGALRAATWYSLAQANALAAQLLSPEAPISLTFNDQIGTPGCLTSLRWDHSIGVVVSGQGAVSLFSVLMHEIGHGLGFFSLVDEENGRQFQGFADTYTRNLEDHDLGRTWDRLSDAERQASAINSGNLHWRGGNVRARSLLSADGRHDESGHVRMYAPDPLRVGSSVSHFDTSLGPEIDELMEPFQTLRDEILLSDRLMQDLGWSVNYPVARSIEDLNGNGSREIVVLRGADPPDGHKVVIIDSRSGQSIREIPLPADVSAIDLQVLSNFADLPFEEIAVLTWGARGDRTSVVVFDGGSGLELKTLVYPRGFPIGLRVVPNYAGTSADELAVLGMVASGSPRIWVKDARSSGMLKTLSYPINQVPAGFAILPSFGGTTGPEAALVVEVPIFNQNRLSVRDLRSGQFLTNLELPFDCLPQFVAGVPSFGGTAADEVAILGQLQILFLESPQSTGDPCAQVFDASSGELLSTKVWNDPFRPIALETASDARHTPAAELVVLGRRVGNLRTTLKVFDAASGADVSGGAQADWEVPRSLTVIPSVGGSPADDLALVSTSVRDGNLRVFLRDVTGRQFKVLLTR